MTNKHAVVIGSGPNGLSAAIVAAQAGFSVDVFEAEGTLGGAARTLELTLPGFHHDFGSAVHPMAAASPFFSTLPLHEHGLQWIHSPAALAHPFDDGTAVTLECNLEDQAHVLGADGSAWKRLMYPLVSQWWELAEELLRPLTRVPKHPLALARFGSQAVLPARLLANALFKTERAKALFAGIVAHSSLSLNEPFSASFGIVLGATGHVVGWPIPRGGAQAITNALSQHLQTLGGRITTEHAVEDLRALGQFDLALCDVSPPSLLRIAGGRFTPAYRRLLEQFRYGPGAFKVDYALSQPVPWRAPECTRAATLHLGGSIGEVAASESAARNGKHSERPFVLLSQPTLFDPSRAPAGKHIVWAYCHVPNGSTFDMLPRLEAQIERFAPGFRECVIERRVSRPTDLNAHDANIVGGDINGGLPDWEQILFRPTWRQYATPARNVYLCSASTPPGGGVHGMCGYNAAKLALARLS
ncbi:MAG TPA: NAD(P)/FAD-dependent oxidoreductase [Terriglobales bacterium]